jgi:hypothetical protein
MAIQTDLQTSRYGVPFEAAYIRIKNASIVKGDVHYVSIDLVAFATNPNTNVDIHELDMQRLVALLKDIEDQNGPNFLTNCYLWVMQLPEFAGSIEV